MTKRDARPEPWKDWVAWHRDYDAPTGLARRLAVVQAWIATLASRAPPGPLRVVSMCAGDGRDLVPALRDHPRRPDVTGRLVELNPELAAVARGRAEAAGLGLDVLQADAGESSSYAGVVPADLILACGVFGNISDSDVERTVRFLPRLASAGATVIWTRHRKAPDLTRAIRGWFAEAGFREVAFEPIPDSSASVGLHRLVTAPLPFQEGVHLFDFVLRRPSDTIKRLRGYPPTAMKAAVADADALRGIPVALNLDLAKRHELGLHVPSSCFGRARWRSAADAQ